MVAEQAIEAHKATQTAAVECEGAAGVDHVAVEDEGDSKTLQRNARPNLSAKAKLLPVSIVHPITSRFSSWT
jgi:hypothetical protein